MIEDMEAELTELLEINSKTDNLAVTKEADIDEDIPIYLKKEQKTQAYKKITNIDIEKINTFEKRNNANTKEWRTIYKVIEEAYFEESDFLRQSKDNEKEAQFLPLEVKNNIKQMATEQG